MGSINATINNLTRIRSMFIFSFPFLPIKIRITYTLWVSTRPVTSKTLRTGGAVIRGASLPINC